MNAADVMSTRFHLLHPQQTLVEAVDMFRAAGETEGRRIFGMMVTDDEKRLVGMLSMHDVLVFLQPRHTGLLDEMDDLAPEPVLDTMRSQVRQIRVEDIMSVDLISVRPTLHLLAVSDLMIRRHVRRLPVVEDGEVRGIVYRSDVFFHLMDRLSS